MTNFLIGQEFSSNKVLEYIDPEDKKNRIEIKLLKHSKTPERFVNLIIELKYLTSQIQDRETTIAKLEQKLNEATTKYNKMEQDFKSQVELMQNKAQQTINEHTKKMIVIWQLLLMKKESLLSKNFLKI